MISERNVDRMASYLLPQKIILGRRHDEVRRYVVSAVMYPVTWTDAVMQDLRTNPARPAV